VTLRGNGVGRNCLAADLYPFREGHFNRPDASGQVDFEHARGTQPVRGVTPQPGDAPRRLRGRPSGIKGRCATACGPPLTPEPLRPPDRPTAGAGQGACPRGARRSLGSVLRQGIPQPPRTPSWPWPAPSAPASGHSRRVHLGGHQQRPDTKASTGASGSSSTVPTGSHRKRKPSA
jgi:hypothetical protein